MTDPRLIGIHFGPAEVRVAVYARDGTLVDAGRTEVRDQTAVAWERALREATPPMPDEGICSVASTSGSMVVVDETGEPVFPPQMYYTAAPDNAARLREMDVAAGLEGRDIALSATAPLPKLLQLREEYPDRFADAEWVLSPTTWLLYRLRYGRSTRWRSVETDWTNALKFGADITPALPEWHDPLLEAVGVSRDLFPTIRPPGTFIGTASGELAERTGLEGIKLYQGVTDGSASALATDCLEPGDFSLTVGETSLVKYVSESITAHDALYYHRHPLEGYLPGASFDSGAVLNWFCDRLMDCTRERGLELARETPPGEEYEVFLQGSRSPFFDPDVGTSILGINHDTALSAAEVTGRFARGVATGVALAEHTYIRIVEELFGTDIDTVRMMSEMSAKSGEPFDWWYDLRSSVWGRPVVQMQSRTAAGLLIPPALITSVYDDADEASECLLGVERTIEPDPAIGDLYADRRRSYFDRWQAVTDLYRTDTFPGDTQ
jgi:xylulokinase